MEEWKEGKNGKMERWKVGRIEKKRKRYEFPVSPTITPFPLNQLI